VIPKHDMTSFYATFRPEFERAGLLLGGIAWELIATQAAVESNFGNSALAYKDNNYFGLTAGSWLGIDGKPKPGKSCVNYPTKEQNPDGTFRTENRWFRKFPSMAACIDNYVYVLGLGIYAKALERARAGDATAFFQELKNAGYASDQRYAVTLARRYLDFKSQEGLA